MGYYSYTTDSTSSESLNETAATSNETDSLSDETDPSSNGTESSGNITYYSTSSDSNED